MEAEELELKEHLKELKKKELERRRQTALGRDSETRENAYKPSAIYISNLPTKANPEAELIHEFSKYGMIRRDQDGNVRCKIYKDEDGNIKGDALMIYARHESVPIAIEMMDGYELDGKKIKVEIASFTGEKKRNHEHLKTDEDDTSLSKRIKSTTSDLPSARTSQNDESDDIIQERARTIVIANVIDLYDNINAEELADIRHDLLDGCKATGPVEHIKLDARKGEATVVFENETDAQDCCRKMHKRFFDGRELAVFMLDEENESQSSDSNEEPPEDDLIDF